MPAKQMTKAQILRTMAADTGLSKAEVAGFFLSLERLAAKGLAEDGRFRVLGICELQVRPVPARQASTKVGRDGNTYELKAREAGHKVIARPTKALRDRFQKAKAAADQFVTFLGIRAADEIEGVGEEEDHGDD